MLPTTMKQKILTATFALVFLIALAWALVSYDKSKASAWNRIKNTSANVAVRIFCFMVFGCILYQRDTAAAKFV